MEKNCKGKAKMAKQSSGGRKAPAYAVKPRPKPRSK